MAILLALLFKFDIKFSSSAVTDSNKRLLPRWHC